MGKHNKIVAAVDVGTTKVVVIAGRIDDDGKIEILGVGKTPSLGVKRGVILNIRDATEAVHKAIRQAEDAMDIEIDEIYVNIGGQQLKTCTFKSERLIGEKQIVSDNDIAIMLKETGSFPLPAGHKVYHVVPQLYRVDKEEGIFDPVGMTGEKLEVDFKLLVAPESYEHNLQLCFDSAGIKIRKAMADSLAASEILLSDDEKEAGVILLDIGGGTTKMAIYHEGVLCYCSLIPFGGNVITNDIKEGCSILVRQAEALKVQYGQAIGDLAPEDKVVTIPGISGWEPKEISFKNLAYIIQARMEDIIDAFFYQVEKSGYAEMIKSGIVLSGGGALLPNLNQLINFRTGMAVRPGVPRMKFEKKWQYLENPAYSTVLGLFLSAVNDSEPREPKKQRPKKGGNRVKPVRSQPGLISSIKERVAKQMDIFFDSNDNTM